MKLQITITMDNAAFFEGDEPQRNHEAARILHLLAQKIDNGWEMEADQGFPVLDINGNRVGKATVTE